MTVRDQILVAVRQIICEKFENKNEFTVPEVLHTFMRNDIPYDKDTVTTHITTRLCANNPNSEYKDFERIRDRVYRLLV